MNKVFFWAQYKDETNLCGVNEIEDEMEGIGSHLVISNPVLDNLTITVADGGEEMRKVLVDIDVFGLRDLSVDYIGLAAGIYYL